MRAPIVVVLALAAVMAGCAGTGEFNVEQTEPLRVQIEGEGQEAVLREDGTRQREFVVVRGDDDDDGGGGGDADVVQKVVVVVNAEQRSPDPARIVVIVRDEGGDELERRTIEVEGTTVDNIEFNVRGNNNVIVVTQVDEGAATVNVAAHEAGATTAGTTTESGEGDAETETETETETDVDAEFGKDSANVTVVTETETEEE